MFIQLYTVVANPGLKYEVSNLVFSDACTHILKMCIHSQLNQDVANQITHVHTPVPQTCSHYHVLVPIRCD